jgi:hypothetical protein
MKNPNAKESTVITQTDWRLQGQDWLREELLRYERYTPVRHGSEHDHCEFCWVPFRTRELPGTVGEGYVTQDRRWICDTCYEDFKLMFEWVLET